MDSDLQSQKMNGGWHFGIEDMRSDEEEEEENNGIVTIHDCKNKME